MADLTGEIKDSVKEPEEPEHQAECLILNATGDNKSSENKDEEIENQEKGQQDTEPEADKQEKDENWIFVLGHDLLKKRTLRAGEGLASRPVNSQVVTFRYSGRIYEGDDTIVDSSDHAEITLGDGDSLMAFDLCLALMEKGEVCEVVTDSKYAYGPAGKPPCVPPNASLHYELELLSVCDPPDPATLPPVIRVAAADSKRERGNSLYAKNEFTSAINSYSKALRLLDVSHDVSVTEASDRDLLTAARLKCYNNLAAAQLKVEAWDAAIKSSEDVLRIEPTNVKALFRKGKCLAGKGDLDDAITTLKLALKLEPETKIIHQELSRLVNKQKSQTQKSRDMYRRMMGNDENRAAKKKASSWRWYWPVGAAAALLSLGLGVLAHRQVHNA